MSLDSKKPKPDLSDHEEEATPFDDVMRKLLDAKPTPKEASAKDAPPSTPDASH